jgi:hypothetical protein
MKQAGEREDSSMARKSRVVALGAAVGIGIAIITRWREQVFGLLRRGRTQAAEPPVASSSWPEGEVAEAQITEGVPEEQGGPPAGETQPESERAEEEQPTEESAQPEAP